MVSGRLSSQVVSIDFIGKVTEAKSVDVVVFILLTGYHNTTHNSGILRGSSSLSCTD